jgi:hypothetical protein
MNFLERAQATVAKGAPVIRLKPRTKIARDDDWPSLATTDSVILAQWNDESPEANCAAVAQASLDGVWFFEIDDPSVPGRIEAETGQKIPLTYRVRSRPGRGHYYWKQNAASIALGNVAQGFVKNGDFSVRVDREYVVAAGSIHPISGDPYEVVCTAPIIEAPLFLIDWIKSQRIEKAKIGTRQPGDPKIPHGQINSHLVSIIGTFIAKAVPQEAAEAAVMAWAHENCEEPIDDDKVLQDVRGMYGRYPLGSLLKETVLFGGKPLSSTAYSVAPAAPLVSLTDEGVEELPELVLPPYPIFPEWVMLGTSIYEGLVKPFCDVNSRYEEYMFMPAMALLLNYVANKVRVEHKQLIPSLFMVLIGRKGKIIKSSSVESAIEYFKFAGMVEHGNTSMENANSKALVWEIGSPEGLGIEMSRLKCRNGILFYDELSTLTNKAGIDGSTLTSRLLALYESGKFQNLIKSKKESFSFDPGSYCVSLIACCTDKNFTTHWSKLSGRSSGLDERFFFLYQPEKFKALSPQIHVATQDGALLTRKLVDAAIKQSLFKIENLTPLQEAMAKGVENREEIRAEKFALYFAIDLGRDEIDCDCIERALALVEYEKAVKKYVQTYEATTKEGAVQMELRLLLKRSGGEMSMRDVTRAMHPERGGTTLWTQAYQGLVKNRIIKEVGTGKKGDAKRVILLQDIEDED